MRRETLGDEALRTAAAAGDWTDLDIPSLAGEALLVGALDPAVDRRTQTVAAARAYAAGGSGAPPAPDPTSFTWDVVAGHFDGTSAATVTQLAGLHRATATDGLGADTSAVVRGHLERMLADQAATAGVLGFGGKGGSLPGLLSNAFTVRRTDGTVGVSVISLSRMPEQPYLEASMSGAPVLLSQQALLDGDTLERLRTAVMG